MEITDEIYPMPAFPLLRVADLEASASWYQEALGFRHIFTMPGPGGVPGLVHLRWAKYADLLLTSQPVPPGPRGQGVTLTFGCHGTGRAVDQIAAQATAAGATILSPPADTPWNTHEFTVADPDGYQLNFTEGPVHKDWGMDRVIANNRQAES